MTKILVTGAAGMIGRALLAELAGDGHEIVATDLAPPAGLIGSLKQPPPAGEEPAGRQEARRSEAPSGTTKARPSGGVERSETAVSEIAFLRMDVTGDDPARIIGETKPEVIVHLASIVDPPKGMTGGEARDFAHAVDVTGTQNVLHAALANGVRRLVVTSSGAAYGYHADNPVPLRETDPVRGNAEFPYAHHKRLVEEMLEAARHDHPALEQVVLRVGTVLGEGTDNQITALFRRPRLLAIAGSESPFVFIWTRDLARILKRAATDGPPGIYNVAGDGALGVTDLAAILGKPVLRLPAFLLKAALAVAGPLGLSRYGPEQVRFLQYRPVLANDLLKRDFGYVPEKTSAETFEFWRKWAGL